VAGEDKKTFHAHAAILCKSKKLKALIEGEWADKEKIVLSDWDEETVARLLEWLYSGSYTFPFPEVPTKADDNPPKTSHPPKTSSRESINPSASDTRPTTTTTHTSPTASKAPAVTGFKSLETTYQTLLTNTRPPTLDPLTALKTHLATTPPLSTQTLTYHPTLTAHSKLYVLSSYMILPPLTHLTHLHLQSTLLTISRLTPRTTPSLVSLTRYVYANTDPLTHSTEPLRCFLSSYIALNFAAWKGEEVDALMETGGDFVTDIARKVSGYVGDIEGRLEESLGREGPKKRRKTGG